MRRPRVVVGVGLVVLLAGATLPLRAQLPFTAVKSSGQTVTPAFEGWYRNPDGTFSISFGYFNRNADEVVQIPIGPDNFIEPGDANQGQPAEFQPRRNSIPGVSVANTRTSRSGMLAAIISVALA